MYDTYQVIDFSRDSEFFTQKREDVENGYFKRFEKFIE